MSSALRRLIETFSIKAKSGYATPQAATVYETPCIPLCEVIKLYERDPTCKASVDLLAASAVGAGFYTTVNEDYEKSAQAKSVVDNFNENVNLDALLCDMARMLIACGNDFWLKLTPQNVKTLHRLPVDAVERIQQSYLEDRTLKIPYKIESYKLRSNLRRRKPSRRSRGPLAHKLPRLLGLWHGRLAGSFALAYVPIRETSSVRIHESQDRAHYAQNF